MGAARKRWKHHRGGNVDAERGYFPGAWDCHRQSRDDHHWRRPHGVYPVKPFGKRFKGQIFGWMPWRPAWRRQCRAVFRGQLKLWA